MGGPVLITRRIWCALVLSMVAWITTPLAASDLSDRLVLDARDGRLDDFDFITAALIAGGVDDECELAGWTHRYAEKRDELLNSISAHSPMERLQAVHNALHAQVLCGMYDPLVNDLRLTFARGDFNCLTSLAISLDLSQAGDLPIEIYLEGGHVRAGANIEDRIVVVEPGTPQWQIRPDAMQPAGRRISPIELLGKFYYNRGVEQLKEERFAEGIELLQRSLEFDPDDANARANLAAGFNNWAVEQLRADRSGEAAALIKEGLRIDPSFAPLLANQQLVRAKLTE